MGLLLQNPLISYIPQRRQEAHCQRVEKWSVSTPRNIIFSHRSVRQMLHVLLIVYGLLVLRAVLPEDWLKILRLTNDSGMLAALVWMLGHMVLQVGASGSDFRR